MVQIEPGQACEGFLALRFAALAGAFGIFGSVAGEGGRDVVVVGRGRDRDTLDPAAWSSTKERLALALLGMEALIRRCGLIEICKNYTASDNERSPTRIVWVGGVQHKAVANTVFRYQ